MTDLELSEEEIRCFAKVLKDAELCSSVSEGIRLIHQGAVTLWNESTEETGRVLFKVGKRKFKRVIWNKHAKDRTND